MIVSLGASLAFPTLSIETNAKIDCYEVANASKNLNIIEMEYPKKIKGILFPTLSEYHPPNNLIIAANPSP